MADVGRILSRMINVSLAKNGEVVLCVIHVVTIPAWAISYGSEMLHA